MAVVYYKDNAEKAGYINAKYILKIIASEDLNTKYPYSIKIFYLNREYETLRFTEKAYMEHMITTLTEGMMNNE